ncbi:MAG: transporter substrate-binding domain-containing protein [Planctomycetes bacterium]|nr:transporter substrate-binding domain-containing protein [Planctomycetota bacterium]
MVPSRRCLAGTVCGLFIILSLFALQAADGGLAAVKQAKKIRVAVPQGSPPFGYVGTDMRPVGYDIDMATIIAQDLGVAVEIIPVTSTNRVPYLTSGKVDLIISSLGKNPEREEVIDFSDAYAPFYCGVFGPAGTAVAGPEGLDGASVAVTRGSVEDLELTALVSSAVDVRRFDDVSVAVSAYLTGQVRFLAVGNVVAGSVNAQNPDKAMDLQFILKNSPCYVGIAKNQPDLTEAVNSVIAAAKRDGRLAALSEKWLHVPLPADL